MKARSVGPFAIIALFVSATESHLAATYIIKDLGAGSANDVNNLGHVAGTRTGVDPVDGISTRGFFYDGNEVVLLTSTNRFAYAVIPWSGEPLYYDEVLVTADGINDSDHISGTCR